MLPRQYKPGRTRFPQMNHVSCTVLKHAGGTPMKVPLLKQAVTAVLEAHPLLRAHVEGDGEPDARIDLFQMVRKGDPHPPTFVASRSTGRNETAAAAAITADDILTVVDCVDDEDVDASWKAAFQRDLDDGGAWCHPETGPLWKLELHRSTSSSSSTCALLFSANHALSDQSSANRLVDQILRLVAELERGGEKRRR